MICTKCGKRRRKTNFYVGHKQCKPCIRDAASKWARDNRGRKNAKSRAWKKANREKVKACDAQWRSKNLAKWNRITADWWKAHPEKLRAKHRRHYYRHRVQRRAKSLAWQRRNPLKVRASHWRYASRKRGATGVHTAQETLALLRFQRNRCAHCRTKLSALNRHRHLDHKTPLSRGGSNGILNLQWLCARCNTSKGSKTMTEWRAFLKAVG